MSGIHGVEWDDGNWPKCAKHGVSKPEIEHVLTHEPLVMLDRTATEAETRFNAVGLNAEGRHLLIVYTFREYGDQTMIRPISARYMHDKEIAFYEQSKGPQAFPRLPDR